MDWFQEAVERQTERGQTKPRCLRDTNGDGDCERCVRLGCPLRVFCPVMLDRAVMSEKEAAAFRANAEPFEYTEPWLGTIKGWRSRDGTVLIERCEPT